MSLGPPTAAKMSALKPLHEGNSIFGYIRVVDEYQAHFAFACDYGTLVRTNSSDITCHADKCSARRFFCSCIFPKLCTWPEMSQPCCSKPYVVGFVCHRAEADRLYTMSKKLLSAHEMFMEAAQAALKADNRKGYEENIQSSRKAKQEGRAAYHEANSLSWTANNQKVQTWSCDLHGMGTTKALAKVANNLENLRTMGSPGGVVFTIITGKGNHSDGNVGKIKLNVLKYLEDQARSNVDRPWFKYGVDAKNDGVVTVEIFGSQSQEP